MEILGASYSQDTIGVLYHEIVAGGLMAGRGPRRAICCHSADIVPVS